MLTGGEMIKKFFIPVTFFTLILFMTSCGGSGGGSSSTARGVNPGIPSIVKMSDVQNIVQTNSTAFFKVRILDGNGVPVPNEPVTFTNLSSIGTLNAVNAVTVAYTNDLGFATATVFSAEDGFVTVQAEVNSGAGQVRDRRTVFFTSGSLALFPFMILDVDGDGDGIYNEPNDFILLEDATDNEVLVRATVFNRFGLTVSGIGVLFGADAAYRIGTDPTCTDGTDDCEVVFPDGVQRITNSSGQAFVRVRFEPNSLRSLQTLFNVLALADNGAFNLVTLFVDPIFINSVTLSADPSIVETDGTSTIAADVITNLNSPPPDGTTVNFVTTCGSVLPFGQTTDGRAEVDFTAPSTEGTCTVTGSVGGVSGSVNVIVSSTLSVLPSDQTVSGASTTTVTYTIAGGVAPYSVFSDDPTLLPSPSTVTFNGGTFSVTVPAGTPATTVTYTVRDSAGQEATATLNVEAAGVLAISPASVGITDGAASQNLIFQITGGVPAPAVPGPAGYSVSSSIPAMACNDGNSDGDCVDAGIDDGTWQVLNDGDTFTVTIPADAISGTGTEVVPVILTAQDSASGVATATINVTNDPP
jgi:hypothetical protein